MRRRTGPRALGVVVALTAGPASAWGPPAATELTRTTTTFRPDRVDAGRAVLRQSDGGLLVAGVAGGDFGLARKVDLASPDFAEDNRATTDFGGADGANALTLDPLGRPVLAGWTGGDVALARYDTDGHLDRSFGTEGRVVANLGGADDAGHAVLALADGRVVVAGGNASSMVLFRYGVDGTPDAGFGAGGRVTVASDGPGRGVVALADGSFAMAGGGPAGFHVVRISADGTQVTGLGADGAARIPLGAPAVAVGITLLPDGRMTVGGSRAGDVALVRLLPAGGVDLSFGTLGLAVADLGGVEIAHGMALDADGRHAVVGERPGEGFIVVFRPDGTVDTGYQAQQRHLVAEKTLWGVVAGPGGAWHAAAEWARAGDASVEFFTSFGGHLSNDVDWDRVVEEMKAAIRLPDGRILFLAATSGVVGLARLRPDGSLDPTFGRGGRVVSDIASHPRSMAVQADGRIIVAGWAAGRSVLVAFSPDGALDTSWGTDRGRTPAPADTFVANLDPHDAGGVITVGSTSTERSAVARYTAGGQLDASFGAGGSLIGSFDAVPFYAGSRIVRQPDGKRLIISLDRTFHRMNVDGTADRSFGVGGTVTIDFPAYHLTTVAVLPNGQLLVGTRGTVGMARYNADGSRDTSFRSWGHVNDVGSIILLPDGRFLEVSPSHVARYLPTGAADRTFGVAGMRATKGRVLDGAFHQLAGAWVERDGVVVSVGTDGYHLESLIFTRFAVPRTGAPGVRSWGGNALGQLGTGDLADRRTAAGVAGLTGVVDVAAGYFHSLARRADGTVWAWGWNGVGQLGDGTVVDRQDPVQVVGLSDVVGIAAGAYHSLALKGDGTVWAWGWNLTGQLGDGTTTDRHLPVRASGLNYVAEIAAGALHSLARTHDDAYASSVLAWGWNGLGQLGDGTTTDRWSPVEITNPRDRYYVSAIAAGSYHSVLLTNSGTVSTWGWNGFGQLGDGTTVDRHRPAPVRIESVRSIAAGGIHTVVRDDSGSVWSWGWNGAGQLGDGTTVDRHVPVRAVGLSGIETVAAGLVHTAALTRDGTVFTWGWNAGSQLGDGTTVDRPTPRAVASLGPATAVAAGGLHTVVR